MGVLRYKGYVGSIEYSEADDCFVGRVLGLRRTGIIFEGKSVDQLKQDFRESIDYYLDDCKQNDAEPEKPYSGRIILRMPPSLHGEVAEKAASAGISLNEFINRALRVAVG
ncbi:MAG: type II toxin-antitoxin system HicB family antitoxin [Bacteroidales bacterium]|jgi:predicted HicB family RNase H-like nuclease|nr:type II toxin-antitoxin system HicB family antitoxin [Bacteroidales bacterium]